MLFRSTSRRHRANSTLSVVADEQLARIVKATGHTGYVAMLDGGDVLGLRMRPGSKPLRVVTSPGDRLPAFCSSTGRALLARLDDATVRALYSVGLQPPSPNAPQTVDDLPGLLAGEKVERQAQERIAFLAGEADRWRNTPDLTLKHCNGPDHYIDLEELDHYGLKPAELPVFRFDFVGRLATTRVAKPDKFPPPDPEQDADHTRSLVGLLPWCIVENYGKLKSGFSYLKAYEQHGGTPEEIANAQANIIYIMGVMGHYVGDGSQPLHATIHHHGWVGANPHNYRTNRSIHSWIDGGYFNKVGLPKLEELKPGIRPARYVQFGGRDASAEEIFPAVVQYLEATLKEVDRKSTRLNSSHRT